ncbi:hypothetical protein MMC25_003967 [Agyrium rufum]|nr:hypothetical protein [Agyrium rufum]
MADNPDLQAKLHDLDQELEEGEITTKGYQKRRTLILSQYLSPAQIEQVQGQLRVHSAEDTSHPTHGVSGVLGHTQPNRGYAPPSNGQDPMRRRSFMPEINTYAEEDEDVARDDGYGHNQGGRSQGRGLVVRNADDQDSNYLMDTGHQAAHNSSVEQSREGTMMTSSYAFNPANQPGYQDQPDDGYRESGETDTRHSTLLDQGYFSDFAGHQGGGDPRDSYGGGPNRYSTTDAFSPTAAMAPPPLKPSDLPSPATVNHQLPLEPRDVPFAVYDPHNSNVPMSKFDNIAFVLRHRAKTNPKQPAYWVLDGKGKETSSITWDKLASRAEKVAQVIRDKSNLYRGDRVALVYRDTEIIDFAVALMGCFIAGVLAVPINFFSAETILKGLSMEDYNRLNVILTTTQAHLALTTDANLKNFERDITRNKLSWPRGVEWWKTNDFGSFTPKKKDEAAPLVVPELAYIEFSRAPTGDLRGVMMSHRTIMHQMACLSAIIATVPTNDDTFKHGLRDKQGRLMAGSSGMGENLLSYLDPRQGIGMILAVLLTVYGGHTTVWLEASGVRMPGLYANLITKYKTTLMIADYPGLKHAAYNYQSDPMATRNFKKNVDPNFSTVKLCMIDTLTVDCEFHEILADRWLRPMRNTRAREIVAPMLCLPEHGGMVISMRDWLGGEDRMGVNLKIEVIGDIDEIEVPKKDEKPSHAPQNGYSSLIGSSNPQPTSRKARTELSEILIDKESLKTNEVVVLAVGEEAKKRSAEPGTVRVGAFGFPIPDATLAVVDPETSLLCTPYVIGEIWVDSPSLSGGFWALPKHTESIFHAKPYRFHAGNPTPMVIEPEFLRTGLLGCAIEGKIYILGLYEDRLRQKVEWVEHGMEVAEYRYFFVQHLIISIIKNVPKIYDASAFDVFVNDEHLPVILLESSAASTAPTTAGGPPRQLDTAVLDSLSERCMDVLYQEHHVRVFCVMFTAPDVLRRVVKNGRPEIGNMLCRREFELGTLPCVHVKFGVERAIMNLPVGVDPVGGIWSPLSTQTRQNILELHEKQYSGVDYREVVIDDRTSTPLNNFSSIVDLFQWRVARQADELSYCTIDGRGREGKGVTWKKFDMKVAAVAIYLQNKVKIKAGDHVIVMYTHTEEYVFAIHALFCLGAIVVPMAPLDQNRLNEDAPAFLHLVADFRVKAVLVNADTDHLLRQKVVAQHMKQSAQVLGVAMPNIYNTTKPSRQSSGCRDLGLTMKQAWVQPGHPVLIWTYWTPDQRRIAVQLGHDTIMGMCKVQKETCQMTSSRPVLGCVRSTSGLGFIHTVLMGIFVGAPTYLVSPVDFAANPGSLFLTLSRYKIKDTYATTQMLDHAMGTMIAKGFQLHEMKNMMIATEGRPRVDVFQKVRLHFATAGLDRTAINTIYSHVLNPMIASRSYMCIEPIELWLDTRALRRGLIYPVDPDSDPGALLLQDSGMVPVSTQIAIVNPETCRLCHIGEYGEIWVQSEACVKSFYGSKDLFDAERFRGHTFDGDLSLTYVRTGDLGFLHNVTRPIGPNGQQVEMQVLFVLGNIGETFEVNGLSHFPMDIEASVERCHRNIVQGGCAVFQAGGLIVVLVEVIRKAYLASVVPVIVNAILNEHQVVVDIVAFVSRGDFPRSRLGEKQRGKILASWVTRKMRTIAQFGIRDPDGADSQITEVPEEHGHGRNSMAPTQHSLTMGEGSSTAVGSRPEISPLSSEIKEPAAAHPPQQDSAAPYESSIQQSPPYIHGERDPLAEATSPNHFDGADATHELNNTPSHSHNPSLEGPAEGYVDPDPTPLAEPSQQFNYDLSPANDPRYDYDEKPLPDPMQSPNSAITQQANQRPPNERDYSWELPLQPIQPHPIETKPLQNEYQPEYNNPYTPSRYGESEEDDDDDRYGGYGGPRRGGGLRVANADPEDEDEEWGQDALKSMNLHHDGGHERTQAQGHRHTLKESYDGTGYGDSL